MALTGAGVIEGGTWYLSAKQAHGHAMIVGWGGGMILGVALFFLPKLRGSKPRLQMLVPWAFWGFAAGVALRVVGQPLLATDASSEAICGAFVGFGVLLEAAAVSVILLILLATFRTGPPLIKKQAFVQVLPLLLAAAVALAGSEGIWVWAAIERLAGGDSLALIPPLQDRVAIEMLLFGGVAALALGMSARLFTLTFRRRPAARAGLWLAAALFCAGTFATALQSVPGIARGNLSLVEAVAACAYALGILTGIFAIHPFSQQPKISERQREYHLWRDPAGVGMVSACSWALVSALLLLAFAWQSLAQGAAGTGANLKDLSRHAMGLGYMTMLIMSVGWTMLPGFAGEKPRGAIWVWAAVVLANLAALLRIGPGLVGVFATEESGEWRGALWTWAGIAALGSVGAFWRALSASWKREARDQP